MSGPRQDDGLFETSEAPGPGRKHVMDLVLLATESRGLGSVEHHNYQVLRRVLGVKTDVLADKGGADARNLQLDERFGPTPRRMPAGSPWIASRTTDALRKLPDPFGGILEAPPDVHSLWADHKDRLEQTRDAYREAMIQLVVDAILAAQPELESKQIDRRELIEAGWLRKERRTDLDGY